MLHALGDGGDGNESLVDSAASWGTATSENSLPETNLERRVDEEKPSERNRCGAALIIAAFNCAKDYASENRGKAFAAGALGVGVVGGCATGGFFVGGAIATKIGAEVIAGIVIKTVSTVVCAGLGMMANAGLRWCFFKPQIYPTADNGGTPSINTVAPVVVISSTSHPARPTAATRGRSRSKNGQMYSIAKLGLNPEDPFYKKKGETPDIKGVTAAPVPPVAKPIVGSAPDPHRVKITIGQSPRL